jgi:cob(I)alamin adenosyltransferase|tara:strand:+ start:104 stop:643 length:540 start_codon:yes stop_codon:yes gene_type:complete
MAKRITKVTTKRGDDGSTGMADGTRVLKSNLLVKAIGELDELNSWMGLLCSLDELNEHKEYLQSIQNRLFDIGGILTTKSEVPLEKQYLLTLEKEMDNLNRKLPDLDNFILPGGSKESSFIHIARTVCRRAERSLIEANRSEKMEQSCLIYINRLSDFLFVLARKVNLNSGNEELLWEQ